MKESVLSKRTIEVNFNENNEAEIIVWSSLTAGQMTTVANNAKIELSKENFGNWTIITNKIKRCPQYKFLLSNKDQYPDPVSEGTILKSKLQWNLIEKDDHKIMFDYCKLILPITQQLCKKISGSSDPKWNRIESLPNEIKTETIIIQTEAVIIYQTHF